MEERIRFTKMHGIGNDYIYVNTLLYNLPRPEVTAVAWSKYHTGIGSDGLVLIGAATDTTKADFSMRIFNADGSEALMCGNASRCIGKYLYERGLTQATTICLETLSGIKVLHLCVEAGEVTKVCVDMGVPVLIDETQYLPLSRGSLVAGDKMFEGTFVSMGNPHFVVFVDNVEQMDIAHYGLLLEHHESFPQRCNIEFAEVKPNGYIRTRVWERGSGITMACGTGACATAVAAVLQNKSGRESVIEMDGGRLDIAWKEDDGHVYMTGEATFVFDGEITQHTY